MDRIDWVNGKPIEAIRSYSKWRDAVQAADAGDLVSLVQLLRSDEAVGVEARYLIADLLERHRLVKRQGRPAVPSYKQTESEARIAHLRSLYRYYRKQNDPDASVRLALWHENSEDEPTADDLEALPYDDVNMLFNAVGGRRGSTNRKARTRP